MQLKNYQDTVLEIRSKYLRYAKETDPDIAFQKIHKEFPEIHFKPSYKSIPEVKNVPYICMRIPTGGGKTILAGYSIKVAIENYIQRDYPVVLWLVPTNTIREQTKKHFMDVESPYYKALADEFDGKFAIYDITDVNRIRPVDLETKVCIIIGTFASLRINNTDGRKFYSSNENLEPIFTRLNLHTDGLEKETDGERSGQFKLDLKYNEGISDLTQWLDRTIRHEDIKQEKMIGYCSAVIHYLLNVRKIELTKLILLKFILARSLKDKIEKLRTEGMKKSYQDVLFHTYQTEVVVSYDFKFQFDPNYYP